LAIEKMPIDFFGYYSLLTPFVDSYYRIDQKEKAQSVFEQVEAKHQSQLNYFASLSLNLQYQLGEEILTEIERYRALVEAVLDNKDEEKLVEYIQRFRNSSRKFSFLYGEYDYYTALEEFVEGLYLGGENDQARELVDKIADVYDERLALLSRFSPQRQEELYNQIMEELNGYRRVLLYVNLYDTDEYRDSIENRVFVSMKGLAVFDSLLEN